MLRWVPCVPSECFASNQFFWYHRRVTIQNKFQKWWWWKQLSIALWLRGVQCLFRVLSNCLSVCHIYVIKPTQTFFFLDAFMTWLEVLNYNLFFTLTFQIFFFCRLLGYQGWSILDIGWPTVEISIGKFKGKPCKYIPLSLSAWR